jgi:hypothetical protein
MSEEPPGEPFHNFAVEPPLPVFYAHVNMKDLNDGIKYAARLACDRARAGGNNPRNGTLTITFEDAAVTAKWERNS